MRYWPERHRPSADAPKVRPLYGVRGVAEPTSPHREGIRKYIVFGSRGPPRMRQQGGPIIINLRSKPPAEPRLQRPGLQTRAWSAAVSWLMDEKAVLYAPS